MASAPIARAAGAADSTAALILRKILRGEERPSSAGTSGPFEVDSRKQRRATYWRRSSLPARASSTPADVLTAEAVLGDLLTPQMHQRAFRTAGVDPQRLLE